MEALRGIALLARFRTEGFACFTATPGGFLNSLAPMLAITLVAGLRPVMAGDGQQVLLHVLTSLIALLAPPVLSHFLSRLWHREAEWLRYAVAFNWCQSAITLLTVVLILGYALGDGGSADLDGLLSLIGLLLFYWLGVCWFLARRGLALGGLRAVLAVLVINFGTGALVVGPSLLGAHGPSPVQVQRS
jgi:hypothetical protein